MSTYQFNSPIGYSKNPLFYDDNKITNASINQEKHPQILDPCSRVSLDKLPTEILNTIIHELDQFDSLKLLQTNKMMCSIVRPKLYENVVIDRDYSQFNKEYGAKYQNGSRSAITFIKSSYNFKKFLSGYKGTHIQRFQCVSLPDSISSVDPEIAELISNFFNLLKGVKELVWVPDNFDIKTLEGCDYEELVSLVLNIKFSANSLEILKKFPNLTNLQIGPYSTTKNLQILIESVNTYNLGILKVRKFDKETSVPDPSAQNLLVEGLNDLYDYEIHDLRTLCTNSLQKVTKLSLDGLIVKARDSFCFETSLCLEKLTKLELHNISEVKQDISDSFLANITGKTPSLSHLLLDYRESHRDNVPGFLKSLKCLVKLDLTVHINSTKPFNELDCSNCLRPHSETLTHLSIEIKSEMALNFISVPISLQKFDLHWLQNLSSLRVNSTNELDNLSLVRQLPQLQYLNLFGQKAGGSPNLGLGMVHPTVFDEWFKVQHVALIYLNNRSGLRYVKINQCLFECVDKTVVPRDGIDSWFNDIVRIKSIDLM